MAHFLLGFCTSGPENTNLIGNQVVGSHGPYMCEVEWAFVFAGLCFTVIYVVSLLFLAYMDREVSEIGHLP